MPVPVPVPVPGIGRLEGWKVWRDGDGGVLDEGVKRGLVLMGLI